MKYFLCWIWAGLLLAGSLCLPLQAQLAEPPRPDAPLPQESTSPWLRKHDFLEAVGDLHVMLEFYTEPTTEAEPIKQALYTQLRQRQRVLNAIRQQFETARDKPSPLSEEAHRLFQQLINYCQWSERAFDPTDLPLRQLWGFTPEALAPQMPRPEALQKVLKQVNCHDLELQRVPPSLFLKQAQLALNWELFRRGWLIDQALEILRSHKVPAARLQIDQMAYYHGHPPDARAWKVPLPHPREKNRILDYLYLKDQALAIRGDYQDYFLYNGLRYSSLLDPRSGYPRREMQAVYVTAPQAMDAEIIAHATAVLTEEGVKTLLQSAGRATVYQIVERHGLLVPLRY